MNLQRFDTRSIDLLYLVGQTTVPTGTTVIPFRFAAPGPRCVLTLKFLVRQFVDPTTTLPPGHLQPFVVPFDWTVGNAARWRLWVARTIQSENGARIPVQNLLGTRAAPVQVSTYDAANFGTKTDTNGFDLDVQTGGDGIDGEWSLDTDGFEPDPAIMACVRGRYNGIGKLCDAEWAQKAQAFQGYPDAHRLSIPPGNL